MNPQFHYVIAAYALTALMTTATLVASWRAMNRAERRSEALRQDRP